MAPKHRIGYLFGSGFIAVLLLGPAGVTWAQVKSTTLKQSVSSTGDPMSAGLAHAYLTHCASCHQKDGKGVTDAIPALAGNGAVTAKSAETVIRVVLGGVEARDGFAPMPAFGEIMTDDEIAQAVNYVRGTWGNNASADTGAVAVAALRKDVSTVLSMNRPDVCVPVKDATIARAIEDGGVKSLLAMMPIGDMMPTIDEILPVVKKGAPEADPDLLSNALTAAYCPMLMETMPSGHRSEAIGKFAALVYGQAEKDMRAH